MPRKSAEAGCQGHPLTQPERRAEYSSRVENAGGQPDMWGQSHRRFGGLDVLRDKLESHWHIEVESMPMSELA